MEEGDLVGYGVIGLVRALERYDGRVNFRTYAEHVVRGEMRSACRKWRDARRSDGVSRLVFGECDPGDEDRVGRGRELLIEHNVDMTLEEMLGHLPELHRRVLVLKFWRGFTNKEVAEELGYSFQYIYDLVGKALFALRVMGSYAGISTAGSSE